MSILMGNERIIFPQSDVGTCCLVSTPCFVKNPTVFENYLKGEARMVYENVYTYKNLIIYLDQFDIPCPGEKYFENSIANSLYRICFITSNVSDVNLNEWQNRKEIFFLPFKTKLVKSQPHFIHYNPIDEIIIPESHAKSTGTIQKKLCLKNSKFLLQDVLNSYRGDLDHLGVIIEYPFCIGFDGTCQSTNKFVALAVNGNFPKKVIQIKIPYDRYIEYDHVPVTHWSQINYIRIPTSVLDRVIIEATHIGYVYRDVFLCLSHPILNNAINYINVNTGYICNVVEKFDIRKDSNITVLDTYRYDCNHTLNRIKFKDIPYDLWCLSVNDESNSFPKRFRPPHLVDHWLNFYSRHCNKTKLDFTNLEVVKLAFVLSKHKVCFKIKITNRNRKIELDNDSLIFRIDEEAVKFLNEIRLDLQDPEENKTDADNGCNVM
ncbi:hypothetical protein HNY73_001039 [Argiope bruennichi]|uniref:Uncharacterized protein n=1 Tax=Argiope bruennichi TaxID=94029 RepID=A0A8T0G635_ARGBR|nr:hypothetical protein HNY73_001039 [Argiope bruennichi]